MLFWIRIENKCVISNLDNVDILWYNKMGLENDMSIKTSKNILNFDEEQELIVSRITFWSIRHFFVYSMALKHGDLSLMNQICSAKDFKELDSTLTDFVHKHDLNMKDIDFAFHQVVTKIFSEPRFVTVITHLSDSYIEELKASTSENGLEKMYNEKLIDYLSE